MKLLNSEFHNKEIITGLNKEQFIALIDISVKGYNEFITMDYLKFGSREGELKSFWDLVKQVESVVELDFSEIKERLKQAIEAHKEKWG